MTPRMRIHIERLIVDGVAFAAKDAEALRQSVERTLAAMVGGATTGDGPDGRERDARDGRERDEAQGQVVAPGDGPRTDAAGAVALGRDAAHAIHRQVHR